MYRAYEMKLLANKKKLKIIDSILNEYRKTASSIFNLYWSNFIFTGKIPQFIDLTSIKSNLSERYKQTCAAQVRGILMSYISNRQNDFKEIIYKSSLCDEDQKIKLLFINKHHKFFDEVILMHKKEIEPETIKLARKIFHHLLKANRLPKMNGISMALDEKVAVVTESSNNSLVGYWVKLSTLKARKQIMLPVVKNKYYEAIKARRVNFIQLNKDRDGHFSVSFIKDIAPEKISFKTDRVSIDLGLTNLLTFNDGSMYGRTYFSSRLKDYDKKISTLCARLQRNGVRPRNSRRYRKLVDICACCGLKLHADINAARCIDARSSSSIANIYKSKAFILDKLVTRFIERQASHYSLAEITQCNPYFRPYSDQIALVTRLSNINGVV